MAVAVILPLVFTLYCATLSYVSGQLVEFEQVDFSANSNITTLVVNKRGANADPISVTISPQTISQYEAAGNTGCTIGDSLPAEVDDFDGREQTGMFPSTTSDTLVPLTFQVRIFEDNVVEGEEVFVVLFSISGGSASTRRTCTIVRIQESFSGDFLRWTYNGEVVTSSLSLEFPERNSSEVIISAERIVPSELTTTITSSLQAGTLTENIDFILLDGTFVILPNMTSINISIFIVDDGITESDESASITLTASVPDVFIGSSATRTVNMKVIDNEVLDYTFVNTSLVINVTEGDSVTVMTGLDPLVPTGTRFDFARILSEDGSALEGTDFRRVDQRINITTSVHSQTIATILTPGAQPLRSFTVCLLPDGMTANQTNVQGVVTIFILDDTRIPLVPVIDTIRFTGQNNDQIMVTWTQSFSIPTMPESFEVIIKSCSKQPCLIDPDVRLSDEMTFSINKDTFQLLQSVDRVNSTFGIVVCAVNSIGRNCTTSYTLVGDDAVTETRSDRTFIIWVVILCVVLFLLCCLLPIVLIVICCCCRRDMMTSYYPRKSMKKPLKGKSPVGSKEMMVEIIMEEDPNKALKFV